MGGFEDFVADLQQNFSDGLGDITRSAIADIGNTGQKILTADASVGPAQGLTGVYENLSYEMEQIQTPAPLEAYPEQAPAPPQHDMDMG